MVLWSMLSVMKNEARWRLVCSIPLALKISVLCRQLHFDWVCHEESANFRPFNSYSQYSQSSHRRKRSYKNTLLRMHHHSWSWEDILHGVYKVLQLFLVQQQQQPQMAAPREFLFFFDNSDNGSTPLFGLNISRRDAAYVSFPRSCSWNSGYFAINWTTFVRYQIGLEIINYSNFPSL